MINHIAIKSRDQWIAMRRKDITASVAGALLGVHPYVTAYGLHLLKSGKVEDDAEETPPMRRGRLLEPAAVQMLREDHPDWAFDEYPVGLYLRDPAARLGATPDVIVTDADGKRGVLQIKTVEPRTFRREWKDESGNFDPPLWIVVQAIVEAYLTGADWAAVAPMVVSFGVELPLIPIPIHAGIIDRIKSEVDQFWARVESDQPPTPDYGRDGSLIAKLFPKDDGTEIDLSTDNAMPGFVDDLAKARTDKKDAEGRETAAKAAIASKIGSASLARIADGRRVSLKSQSRKGYYVNPSEFRVLKVLTA